MAQNNNAPKHVPVHPSSRKVGVELEIDPARDVSLPSVDGWSTHGDGSLSRAGREYVMNPPRPANGAGETIRALCTRLNGEIKVKKAGAMHVHVQAHDYDNDDLTYLANLYAFFQNGINKLVGKSRIGCQWCVAYTYPVSKSTLLSKWNLNDRVSSRCSAKWGVSSRSRYSVVNMCMMRVRKAHQRTVEFRQGSVTKKSVNIEGWVALVVSLVEAAKQRIPYENHPRTIAGLIAFLKAYEEANPSVKHVADWVTWRNDYMNASVTEETVWKAMAQMPRKLGPFTLSRLLDTNLNVALKILNKAVSMGLCRSQGHGVYIKALTHDIVVQEWNSLLQKSKEAEQNRLESQETAESVLPTLPT